MGKRWYTSDSAVALYDRAFRVQLKANIFVVKRGPTRLNQPTAYYISLVSPTIRDSLVNTLGHASSPYTVTSQNTYGGRID